MQSIQSMLEAHPRHTASPEIQRCIDQCFACGAACTICADACLAEEVVADLVACVRLDLDCADMCFATGKVVSRQTATQATVVSRALESCREACRVCAEECERHADHHEHCRICAEACRRCEQACGEALATVTP
jgi:hypothetical protein